MLAVNIKIPICMFQTLKGHTCDWALRKYPTQSDYLFLSFKRPIPIPLSRKNCVNDCVVRRVEERNQERLKSACWMFPRRRHSHYYSIKEHFLRDLRPCRRENKNLAAHENVSPSCLLKLFSNSNLLLSDTSTALISDILEFKFTNRGCLHIF